MRSARYVGICRELMCVCVSQGVLSLHGRCCMGIITLNAHVSDADVGCPLVCDAAIPDGVTVKRRVVEVSPRDGQCPSLRARVVVTCLPVHFVALRGVPAVLPVFAVMRLSRAAACKLS